MKSLLLSDIEDIAVYDLTPAVLAQAVSSLETHVLRGMDAIHIGSAVALQADVFVSAHQRQRDAATRAGYGLRRGNHYAANRSQRGMRARISVMASRACSVS